MLLEFSSSFLFLDLQPSHQDIHLSSFPFLQFTLILEADLQSVFIIILKQEVFYVSDWHPNKQQLRLPRLSRIKLTLHAYQ